MKKIFFIALLLCTHVFAQVVDPSEKYRFLDTPHFKIVFNAQQQALAVHYSTQLEKAYAFLAERFSERPEKIVVVLNDNTDSSNGYATPVPYPHIMLYPVLPLLQEPLGEPSSWSLELATHEFTHILSFYPTNGFMYALKKVFGTIVAPNVLMPLWWLEGVAVYNESTVSRGGRLRSTYQDSVLRSMQVDGALAQMNIAEVNEILPSYPSSRPYLFGSVFWSEMIDQKGIATIDTLHQRQGGRVPYFLNDPPIDQFGQNYENLFNQGLEKLTLKYEEQLKTLNQIPPTTTTPLPWNQEVSYSSPRIIATQSPAISTDGQFLAVVTTDEYLRKNLKIYRRGQQGFQDMTSWNEDGVDAVLDMIDPSKLPTQHQHDHGLDEHANLPSGSIQRVSWFPGKAQIVFDKIAAVSPFQTFSDLYTFDLKSKELKQITQKKRFREPSVSQNGELIAFIEVASGKTKVCVMTLKDEQVTCLNEGKFDEIYGWPTFSKNDQILVTKRNQQGQDQLLEVSFDFGTKKIKNVRSLAASTTGGATLFRFPLPVKDKTYFVTNTNGVPNIFLSQDSKLIPVSHLTTGSLSFAVDPISDAIYLTQITSKGLQVSLLNQRVSPGSMLPQITPVFLQNQQRVNTQPSEETPSLAQPPADAFSDYRAIPFLIPHYWVPFVSTSSQNSGLLVSVQTSSMDPLQYHQYSLFGLYDTYLRRGSGGLTYVNQATPVPFALSANQTNTYLVKNTEPVTNDYASLVLLPSLFSIHKSLSMQAGAFYQNKRAFEENFKKQGGLIQISYMDASKSLSQVTPNVGDVYRIGYLASQDQTKKVDLSQWTFDLTRYESLWLPRFHGLKIRAAGLITTTVVPSLYGDSSTSYEQSGTQFLMRGYPNGQFTGRTFLNGLLEYRLPLTDLNRGAGTTPLFLRRLHMALIADTGRLDGFLYNEKTEAYESVNTGRAFWNAGVEFKVDLTLGYHLPIQLVIGGYQAFDNEIVKNKNSLAIQFRGLNL